jgi:hypothetical protein
MRRKRRNKATGLTMDSKNRRRPYCVFDRYQNRGERRNRHIRRDLEPEDDAVEWPVLRFCLRLANANDLTNRAPTLVARKSRKGLQDARMSRSLCRGLIQYADSTRREEVEGRGKRCEKNRQADRPQDVFLSLWCGLRSRSLLHRRFRRGYPQPPSLSQRWRRDPGAQSL